MFLSQLCQVYQTQMKTKLPFSQNYLQYFLHFFFYISAPMIANLQKLFLNVVSFLIYRVFYVE